MMVKKIAILSLLLLGSLFEGAHAQEVDTPEKLRLVFEDRILQLNFNTNPNLLKQEAKHYLEVSGARIPFEMDEVLPEMPKLLPIDTEFETVIDPAALKQYFESSSFTLKEQGEPLEIQLTENGNIIFEGGNAQDGFSINYERLTALLNRAIRENAPYVRVPADKIFSPVVIAPELQERGIREIIAIGESNFSGSSAARRQNIMAATRKYNGLIIPQGGEFSFNNILGSVAEHEGFVPELVIKGNETVKELGGGVCQVSTTVFRAAFNGGFPLVNRRNHSYAVPYYKPYGLDATIYLGAQDFKFSNDTPGDMLIQAYAQGDDLNFIFYGTDDGRKVKLEGPFVSNYQPIPEPKIFETPDLPLGEEKIAAEGHAGFRTEWVRHIEKDGESEKEKIVSTYRAWPGQVVRGTGTTAAAPQAAAEEFVLDVRLTSAP